MEILNEKIVEKIVNLLRKSISTNNKASLVVSGGDSPKKILNYLDNARLPWNKVEIMLADERLVDPKSKFSNENNLRENFFKNFSKDAKYIPIRNLNIENDLSQVAILGFGLDGHFASIFPEHIGKKDFFSLKHDSKIIQTTPLGNPCVERLTLNLSFFSKVKNIFLIINSQEKLEVLREAKYNKKLPLYYLINTKFPKMSFISDF